METKFLLVIVLVALIFQFSDNQKKDDGKSGENSSFSVYVEKGESAKFGERRKSSLGPRNSGSLEVFDKFGNKKTLEGLSEAEYSILKAQSQERKRTGFFKRVDDLNDEGINRVFKKLIPVSPDGYKERRVETWKEGLEAMADSLLINAPGVSEPKFIHEMEKHILFSFNERFTHGYAVSRENGVVSSWRGE